MSVLISVQALILNENPWENAPLPGREIRDNRSKAVSDDYNCRCQAMTIRFAVLDWLTKKELRYGLWKDVVTKYFELNGDKVIATVERWAGTNRQIKQYGGETSLEQYRTGFYRTQNLLEELQKALARNRKQEFETSKLASLSLGH